MTCASASNVMWTYFFALRTKLGSKSVELKKIVYFIQVETIDFDVRIKQIKIYLFLNDLNIPYHFLISSMTGVVKFLQIMRLQNGKIY